MQDPTPQPAFSTNQAARTDVTTSVDADMHLSPRARVILEQMEPNRSYEAKDLRACAPDITLEHLRDVMRELWVARQVERAGYSGWRRHRSVSPAADATQSGSHRSAAAGARYRPVKPEDLFDHDAFEDIFK